MSSVKVAIVTECPDDHIRSWDAIEHIAEVLEKDFEVTRVYCLTQEPRNGKSAGKREIAEVEDRVKDQLKGHDYVVLIGNTPLQVITGKAGISKKRGKPMERDGRLYLPMNNPSMIKYDPLQETILENDLKLFRDMVDFGGIPEERDLNIRLVLSWDDFDDMMEDLTGTVSFDIETTGLYPWQTVHWDDRLKAWVNDAKPAVVSIGFGTSTTQWIVPFNHPQSPWSVSEQHDMVDQISKIIDDLFVVMHNGKFDLLWMRVHYGVEWPIDFDTMIAHYMLDENMRHGLKFLAMMYCGAPDWEVGLDEKQGKGPIKSLARYHAHDLFYTRALRFVFGKMLNKDNEVKQVFKKIMMPCVRLFVEVEYDGVYIDETQFDEAETYLRGIYEEALAGLKKWEPKNHVDKKGRPMEFNWGSTQQLGKLLFENLGLPVVEMTDAGNASCSESVIKRIDHPCTGDLLKFRGAKQQLSFFIDGWKPYLHRKPNGELYLHPSFKLHGTVTGRLSCENPNLQQVPRDKRIRSLITAPKGWTLIECDLSQIELRIAAELANEQEMLYAFANGIDVHWLTVTREISRGGGLKDLVLETGRTLKQDKKLSYSECIEAMLAAGPDACKEIAEEWGEYRKKAKAINFGYLYGMWWKKFKMYARDNYGVNVTDEEAQESREAFFDLYSDFPDWHKRQKRYVRKHGYVKSLSGRKRRLPEALSAEDTPERREAERQAINSPVQSFANELNLMAALQLRKEFGRNIVRICGTVHDAILLRARDDYVERVHDRLLEIMRRPELMDEMGIDISVPIEGEGKVGPWGKGVSIKKWLAERKLAA